MEWLIIFIFWCIDTLYIGLLDHLILKKAKEEHPQMHPWFVAVASALMIELTILISAFFFGLLPGASYIGYYLVLLIAFVMYVYAFQGICHLPKWNAYFFGSIGFGLHLLFSRVVLPTIGL